MVKIIIAGVQYTAVYPSSRPSKPRCRNVTNSPLLITLVSHHADEASIWEGNGHARLLPIRLVVPRFDGTEPVEELEDDVGDLGKGELLTETDPGSAAERNILPTARKKKKYSVSMGRLSLTDSLRRNKVDQNLTQVGSSPTARGGTLPRPPRTPPYFGAARG